MHGINKMTVNQATMQHIVQQWYNSITSKRPSPKVTNVKFISAIGGGATDEFEITLDSTPEGKTPE